MKRADGKSKVLNGTSREGREEKREKVFLSSPPPTKSSFMLEQCTYSITALLTVEFCIIGFEFVIVELLYDVLVVPEPDV